MVCESALVSGGAEKVAIQEALALRHRGHRVGFIAANEIAFGGLTDAGVELLLLDTKSFFEETDRRQKLQKMIGNKGIEAGVRAFFGAFEPSNTIVHLHTFRLRLSGIVAHIAQDMDFSTLIHCHDYSPVCPTSLLYDHRAGGNCGRMPMSLSCITCECQNQAWKYKLPKLTSHFWNQSIWKINRKSKGLIHISELERRTTESSCGAMTKGFAVPPISDFQSTSRVLAETNEVFLFIGRLTHEKGIEAFLTSASELGIGAVVVGDGPLLDDLKSRFPAVRFTGWLDSEGVRQEFMKARALVVPSLWRETLCLSVIDALNFGVPCIVSETVGAKEFILDGENGVIFSAGALTSSLSRFSDDSFVRNLSEKAFQVFAGSPPSIERHVDALLKVYEEALGRVAV